MLYAIVAVIALIIDQAVKYWTTAHIVLNTGAKELIPGFIHLVNVHNTGAAFSFLEGARWFFVVLCLVFVAVLVFLLVRDIIKGCCARWMAVLVMAGAVGNCIDRIISGYVVDMFEFQFLIFGQQFPVFNVADILITVCGIIFCVCILLEKPIDSKKPAPAKETDAPEVKAPAKAAAPKPRIRRHQKMEIPDFPKHPHIDEPTIDPNDPFAEWERIAAGKSAKSAPPKPEAQPRQTTAPKAASPAPAKQPASPAGAETVTPAAPEIPAVKPVSKAARVDPVAEESYDLEDILAEFRDL